VCNSRCIWDQISLGWHHVSFGGPAKAKGSYWSFVAQCAHPCIWFYCNYVVQPPTDDSERAWNSLLRQFALIHKTNSLRDALQQVEGEVAQGNKKLRCCFPFIYVFLLIKFVALLARCSVSYQTLQRKPLCSVVVQTLTTKLYAPVHFHRFIDQENLMDWVTSERTLVTGNKWGFGTLKLFLVSNALKPVTRHNLLFRGLKATP
jgi:hypothetical protein